MSRIVVHWGRNGAPCCSQAGYDLFVTTDPKKATCTKCTGRLAHPKGSTMKRAIAVMFVIVALLSGCGNDSSDDTTTYDSNSSDDSGISAGGDLSEYDTAYYSLKIVWAGYDSERKALLCEFYNTDRTGALDAFFSGADEGYNTPEAHRAVSAFFDDEC